MSKTSLFEGLVPVYREGTNWRSQFGGDGKRGFEASEVVKLFGVCSKLQITTINCGVMISGHANGILLLIVEPVVNNGLQPIIIYKYTKNVAIQSVPNNWRAIIQKRKITTNCIYARRISLN